VDVNNDGEATLVDLLAVVTVLREQAASGEGEHEVNVAQMREDAGFLPLDEDDDAWDAILLVIAEDIAN
jgi:hypothetical protein